MENNNNGKVVMASCTTATEQRWYATVSNPTADNPAQIISVKDGTCLTYAEGQIDLTTCFSFAEVNGYLGGTGITLLDGISIDKQLWFYAQQEDKSTFELRHKFGVDDTGNKDCLHAVNNGELKPYNCNGGTKQRWVANSRTAYVAAVAAGLGHTCAILSDGTLKCWGWNDKGQCGQGSSSNIGDAVGEMAALTKVDLGTGLAAAKVAASTFGKHTCVLLDNGSLKCFGYGASGELGQGSTDNVGDAPGEMGDALAAVSLGGESTAIDVATGSEHSCAIDQAGDVRCQSFTATKNLTFASAHPALPVPVPICLCLCWPH